MRLACTCSTLRRTRCSQYRRRWRASKASPAALLVCCLLLRLPLLLLADLGPLSPPCLRCRGRTQQTRRTALPSSAPCSLEACTHSSGAGDTCAAPLHPDPHLMLSLLLSRLLLTAAVPEAGPRTLASRHRCVPQLVCRSHHPVLHLSLPLAQALAVAVLFLQTLAVLLLALVQRNSFSLVSTSSSRWSTCSWTSGRQASRATYSPAFPTSRCRACPSAPQSWLRWPCRLRPLPRTNERGGLPS